MKEPNTEVTLLPQLNKACGFDMHKDSIVAFFSNKDGTLQELREFKTFTSDLYRIRDWIFDKGNPACLMESTGVYWMALHQILTKAGVDVTVANASHIQQIPKRKTDRKDARWLCTLLLHGLVRKSFIPDATQRKLRNYCRTRLHYNQHRSRIYNRIVKLLEENNIKLRSVISSMNTKTAMAIVRLLAKGETSMDKYLSAVYGKARKKLNLYPEAINGTLDTDAREQIQFMLDDIEYYTKRIELLSVSIDKVIAEHYAQTATNLQTISGIGKQTTEVIISEIGDDMSKFPSADHLTSWCGLAPGNNESAGKRKSTSTKKGNKYLRTSLIIGAWAAVRVKNSYWKALFEHLKKRMKPQKAIVAISRRMLKVVYKIIKEKSIYQEKGIDHFIDLDLIRRQKAIERQKQFVCHN